MIATQAKAKIRFVRTAVPFTLYRCRECSEPITTLGVSVEPTIEHECMGGRHGIADRVRIERVQ